MTPPNARQAGQNAGASDADLAVLSFVQPDATARCEIEVMRKRADFLRAARAARAPTAAFLLQARQRGADETPEGLRVGFTCSRKIGNAVVRNRAKRRLRALARSALPELGQAGWDYVLVGRPEATVSANFASMLNDLRAALTKVHRPPREPRA